MMLEHIQEYLRQLQVPAVVDRVLLQPLPDELRVVESDSDFAHCYSQAANLALNLVLSGQQDTTYVLGFSYRYQSFEHAIIRVNGVYYDPVLSQEREFDERFIRVWEVSANELFDFLDESGRPPTIYDWLVKSRKAKETAGN